MFSADTVITNGIYFLLAGTRILAMVLTLPKLATDRYLLIYRILFSAIITLVITPLAVSNTEHPMDYKTVNLVSLFISEAGIGICLGLAASCVIIGLHSAGQIVSQLLGFQIGSLQQGLSPEQGSDYRKLFFIIGLTLWFGVSGHRIAVEGLLHSFDLFQVGSFHFSESLLGLVNRLIHVGLEFALRFSLPILVVSLIGFLVAGFFSRILTTGQSTSFGFGLNQLLFFCIAIPLLAVFSDQMYQHTAGQIEVVIDSIAELPLYE